MTKKFSTRVVLTATTGKFLIDEADGGIMALYEFLEFMTGQPPLTHQLGRFADECKPYIFGRYPQLFSVDLPDGMEPGEILETWLPEQERQFGKNLEFEPIPSHAHVYRNPVEELMEIRRD